MKKYISILLIIVNLHGSYLNIYKNSTNLNTSIDSHINKTNTSEKLNATIKHINPVVKRVYNPISYWWMVTWYYVSLEEALLHPSNESALYSNWATYRNNGEETPLTMDERIEKIEYYKTNYNPEKWYAPDGFYSYKAYIPKNTELSNFSFVAKTNTSYRLYLTFEPENGVIDHTTTNTDFIKGKTSLFFITNVSNITLDSNVIKDGGWLYIDIAEDSDHIDSYFGYQPAEIFFSVNSIVTNNELYIPLNNYNYPNESFDILHIKTKKEENNIITVDIPTEYPPQIINSSSSSSVSSSSSSSSSQSNREYYIDWIIL